MIHKERYFKRIDSTLALIFLSSIAVKLIIFYLALDWLGGDEFQHISRGKLLSQGLMPYQDFHFHYPPGFVVITAFPHLFFSNAYLILRVLTAFMDSLNICMVYLLGKELFSPRIAWMASLFYLLNVSSLRTAATTMSEPYLLFFILCAFLFLLRQRPVVASAIFAICIWIKPYLFAWIVPFLYLVFTRKANLKVLVITPLLLLILFSPFTGVWGEFLKQQAIFYQVIHGTYSLSDFGGNFYSLISHFAIGAPFLLMGLIGVFRKRDIRKEVFSSFKASFFIPLWFSSTLFFIFLPNFFPHHHLVFTLPAVCLLSAVLLTPVFHAIKDDGYVFLLVGVSTLCLSIVLNAGFFSTYGNAAYGFQKVMPVVEYLNLHDAGGDFLQDFAFYSYLSGKPDVTKYGFYYSQRYGFTSEMIKEIILETQPRFIIVSESYTYPYQSLLMFQKEYELVYQDPLGYPKVYQTDYLKSYPNPHIVAEILSNRILS